MARSEQLKQRLANLGSAENASLIPAPREVKLKKEKEVIPDAREVITVPAERLKLVRLLEEEGGYAQAEYEAKKSRKPLTEWIKALALKYKAGKFMCGEARVTYTETDRESIDRNKLIVALTSRNMQPKVLAEVLKECTISTPVATLKITRPRHGVVNGGNGDDDN